MYDIVEGSPELERLKAALDFSLKRSVSRLSCNLRDDKKFKDLYLCYVGGQYSCLYPFFEKDGSFTSTPAILQSILLDLQLDRNKPLAHLELDTLVVNDSMLAENLYKIYKRIVNKRVGFTITFQDNSTYRSVKLSSDKKSLNKINLSWLDRRYYIRIDFHDVKKAKFKMFEKELFHDTELLILSALYNSAISSTPSIPSPDSLYDPSKRDSDLKFLFNEIFHKISYSVLHNEVS
jgi:hypothetical protein